MTAEPCGVCGEVVDENDDDPVACDCGHRAHPGCSLRDRYDEGIRVCLDCCEDEPEDDPHDIARPGGPEPHDDREDR
jgi:hypothetical protein